MNRSMNKGVALLANKRQCHNANGEYIVDATCSLCGVKVTLSYSGWSAYICDGCCSELVRSPYRKANNRRSGT